MINRLLRPVSFIIFIALTQTGCSGADNPTPADQPVERMYFKLDSNVSNQFIVYRLKPDGTLNTYDYESHYLTFTVRNGDIITVVCKVGEELLPTVGYRIDNGVDDGETKTLHSSANTSSYYGFRLMRTENEAENFTVEF
ncbi:hypothetical protein [Flavobacterium silvaticum]|uniref:Uncharacterized protein n=1 Tax=Flavobacterium silvaticum TaxID=1852020 RepID=A0A972FMP9_9FLAO|nr:hypothetical protein [Flavobacterium silvaticum]NMH28060.1 hypothetical protein [Flavobacterium silvaticum]